MQEDSPGEWPEFSIPASSFIFNTLCPLYLCGSKSILLYLHECRFEEGDYGGGWRGRAAAGLRVGTAGRAGGRGRGGVRRVRAARRVLMPPDQRTHVAKEDDHGHLPQPFGERYQRALNDERMRAGLLRFQRNWRAGRDASFAQYAEDGGKTFEELRDELAAVKDRVIADTDRLFRAVQGRRRAQRGDRLREQQCGGRQPLHRRALPAQGH